MQDLYNPSIASPFRLLLLLQIAKLTSIELKLKYFEVRSSSIRRLSDAYRTRHWIRVHVVTHLRLTRISFPVRSPVVQGDYTDNAIQLQKLLCWSRRHSVSQQPFFHLAILVRERERERERERKGERERKRRRERERGEREREGGGGEERERERKGREGLKIALTSWKCGDTRTCL